MKKKDLLKTVTFASAILAAGAISFSGVEVSADTLDTTPATANETATPTTNQVTDEQVAVAKAEASTIGDAVKHQETVVADALSTKQSAQAAETTAQTELVAAQETVETATPEAIQAVEVEIVEAETTVSETESLLKNANQEASTAQTQANKAQAVADAANTAYTEAQTQALAAQETVKQLENQTVNLEQAQATVEAAKQEVVTAEANVVTAEQALVTAEAKDQTLAQEIADAKTAVKEAKAKEEVANTEVNNTQAAALLAEKNLETATSAVKNSGALTSYTVTLNLNDELKNAIQRMLRAKQALQDLKPTLEELGLKTGYTYQEYFSAYNKYTKAYQDDLASAKEEVVALNAYDPTILNGTIISTDDTKYNLDNLTGDQLSLVNRYIIDYVNVIRQTFGFEKAVISKPLIEVATYRSDKYEETTPENTLSSHNAQIISDSDTEVLFNKYGVINTTKNEIVAHPYTKSTTPLMTMSEILELAKQSVFLWTFGDASSSFGHFFLLLDHDAYGFDAYHQPITGFNDRKYGSGVFIGNGYSFAETDLGTPTNLYIDGKLIGSSTYEALNKVIQDGIETGSETFQKLLRKQSVANEANDKAQADLAQAVTALNKAKAEVASATSAYNALLSTESETSKAQANLDAATTKLSEAQVKYDQAVNTLDTLTVQKAEQAQKLANAKVVLDQAKAKATSLYSDYLAKQAQADVLKTKVDQLNQDVQNLETVLANAKQAVLDAKAKLLGLQEAEANLVKAQEAYEKAVKAKDEARAVYQTELAKLTDLKNSFTIATNHYLTLLNLYNLQEQVKTPTEVTGDNLGKPSAVKTTAVASASKGQVKYLDVANEPVQTASLPQTGSSESILSSLAGFTVLGLGLSLAIKRRKYTEE
ncbi:TPA: SEC10/PgrA surface exclusion domain-containing protein [Streptococcus suis]